jgi:hypothetical protein
VSSGDKDTWLSVPEVAERLALSPSRVRRLVEDRALLGRKIDGVFVIPGVLVMDDEPLPHLAGTATLLIDGGFSEDSALDWLLAPDEQLGTTPADALRAGRKSEVRRIAQALAV